jgi:hypothetical protein
MRLIIAFALCLVSVGIVNAQLKPPADAESFHWRGNFHGKLEFNSRKGLEKTTETLVNLVQIFAEKS